jgi:hydroxymethylglutaryl-CoA lyase
VAKKARQIDLYLLFNGASCTIFYFYSLMSDKKTIQLIECPRDAMQGWSRMIPTAEKVEYLNALLRVGFDVLDFGSFVSAKAIPQLADTAEVIPQLDLSNTKTKLLAIVANTRGATDAVQYDEITYLGFPFSISETFQLRNTNKTIAQSMEQVAEMQNLCVQRNKELVIYISMGFGNPYGDEYSAEVAIEWVGKLAKLGIKTIAMADTVGVADPANITYVFNKLIPEFRDISDKWKEKIQAAYNAGCLRYDTALKGIGGCPMAEDELVGNIATENVVYWCEKNNIELPIDRDAFFHAVNLAGKVFSK